MPAVARSRTEWEFWSGQVVDQDLPGERIGSRHQVGAPPALAIQSISPLERAIRIIEARRDEKCCMSSYLNDYHECRRLTQSTDNFHHRIMRIDEPAFSAAY